MAGLEHQRRSTHAACFQIYDAADLEGIVGLVVDEGLRAE
jgi:hypothetical protein